MHSQGFEILRADLDEAEEKISKVTGSYLMPVGPRTTRSSALKAIKKVREYLNFIDLELRHVPLAKDIHFPGEKVEKKVVKESTHESGLEVEKVSKPKPKVKLGDKLPTPKK